MAKKPNAWMAHVMRTKAANLGMQLKDVLRKAAETYKKDASSSSSASSTKHKTHKKHGGLLLPLFGGSRMSLGRRGGGSLSPADVKSSGGQLNTTQYSGGKKSRRKSSRKCKSKSKKSSRKSSHKRRGGNMMLEGM